MQDSQVIFCMDQMFWFSTSTINIAFISETVPITLPWYIYLQWRSSIWSTKCDTILITHVQWSSIYIVWFVTVREHLKKKKMFTFLFLLFLIGLTFLFPNFDKIYQHSVKENNSRKVFNKHSFKAFNLLLTGLLEVFRLEKYLYFYNHQYYYFFYFWCLHLLCNQKVY